MCVCVCLCVDRFWLTMKFNSISIVIYFPIFFILFVESFENKSSLVVGWTKNIFPFKICFFPEQYRILLSLVMASVINAILTSIFFIGIIVRWTTTHYVRLKIFFFRFQPGKKNSSKPLLFVIIVEIGKNTFKKKGIEIKGVLFWLFFDDDDDDQTLLFIAGKFFLLFFFLFHI